MSCIKKFLQSRLEIIRSIATQSTKSNFTVVMGNEGGDLDSILGSIYLAMFLDGKKEYATRLGPVVPVLNFPVDELALRNDVAQLFLENNIDASLLLSAQRGGVHSSKDRFLDVATMKPNVILYDHNKLNDSQRALHPLVIGIVDHHFDEKDHLETASFLRTVCTVGSACTLVAKMYHEAATGGDDNDDVTVPHPSLLLAPIVMDTVNFDASQKKVTSEDVAMFEWLTSLEPIDHNSLFKKLSAWKNDIFCLSIDQNLKRDYKFFNLNFAAKARQVAVGIASVPCSYRAFADKYSLKDIAKSCAAFSVERNLDAVVIAFAGKEDDGTHSRQVAFFAEKTLLDDAFVAYAKSSPGGVDFSLIDVEHHSDSSAECHVFSLSDATVSRKRLVPSLTHYLNGKESSL